jgi:hypothetical protein
LRRASPAHTRQPSLSPTSLTSARTERRCIIFKTKPQWKFVVSKPASHVGFPACRTQLAPVTSGALRHCLSVRQTTTQMTGRWGSGDELCVCVSSTPPVCDLSAVEDHEGRGSGKPCRGVWSIGFGPLSIDEQGGFVIGPRPVLCHRCKSHFTHNLNPGSGGGEVRAPRQTETKCGRFLDYSGQTAVPAVSSL